MARCLDYINYGAWPVLLLVAVPTTSGTGSEVRTPPS